MDIWSVHVDSTSVTINYLANDKQSCFLNEVKLTRSELKTYSDSDCTKREWHVCDMKRRRAGYELQRAMTMTMTMTHSEKSHIRRMRAWPSRQECRGHDPTKKESVLLMKLAHWQGVQVQTAEN